MEETVQLITVTSQRAAALQTCWEISVSTESVMDFVIMKERVCSPATGLDNVAVLRDSSATIVKWTNVITAVMESVFP